MKKILIIVVVLGLQCCSPKLQPQSQNYSASVEFINKDDSGTITVRSSGFGSKKELAVVDAQLSAFNILLFKGLPGTDLNVPLVENENDAKNKYSEYFKRLLDQGDYNKFMMSSSFNSEPVAVKGGFFVSLDIKINYNSLRKDLEQNQIIRKFGF